MKNYIDLYIKNYVDCAKMKSNEKSKKEKTITILSRGPKDRYVADLLYLPEYLKGHSNYLYVLDIIDHFSKFCNSYLLNTKEKFEIFTYMLTLLWLTLLLWYKNRARKGCSDIF